MDRIKNVTIGADPEMFLYSESLMKFVPVCGLVGGTKSAPLMITDGGHGLQEDNVMVEYTIPPCKTVDDFVKNINYMKNFINERVLADKGLTTKCVASAMFSGSDLDSEQAQHFGCDPDFNAWTEMQNKVGKGNPLLRTAGGHIHVGFDNPDDATCVKLIKAMDLVLGLQSVLLDPDTERRKVYGKAGAFRPKSYGPEYRVLSTFWTENDTLIKWAYNSTLESVKLVNDGIIITNENDIVKAINTCDKDLALEILDDYNISIPLLLTV